MHTFHAKSPATPTVVEEIPIGAVVIHRHAALWRVREIVEGKTATALHVVRYRGRSTRIITVPPGSKLPVVDGATRP